jgi:hypothetical protein
MVVIIEPELALRRVLVLDRGKVVRSWSGSLQGPASLGPPLVSRTTGAAEVIRRNPAVLSATAPG